MVSSQMLWQVMHASTQSCISLLIGMVPGWVMAPPGGTREPGAGPVPFRPTPAHGGAPSGGREQFTPEVAQGTHLRIPSQAVPGARTGEGCPGDPDTLHLQIPRGYGRLRAMTMRWTWLVPS
ncbi:hypothetical protein GCM10010321_31280 [Streptomyces chartreusis]|nr:hypothetical protein GCM10010321_31280 [Streptomyces chartreusis]